MDDHPPDRKERVAAATIVAIATPPGRGGVGVVRVSGSQVVALTQALLRRTLPPRQAIYTPFYAATGALLDRGIALYFPAPHSYTGEAVLELHAHGSPVVLDWLVETCLQHGARLARPGEFSERAFLSDKLDLAQAEAVADLIASHSRTAACAALRSLEGVFSHKVNAIVEQLIHLRSLIEVALDFSDEDIDWLAPESLRVQLDALAEALRQLLAGARQGSLLREGLSVVIAGPPNAGKSSLINALSGKDVAIVTPIAGTTRDVLREPVLLDGLPLILLDTAGLRASGDIVEQEGMRRAEAELARADHVLWVVEAGGEFTPADLPADTCYTVLRNKIDLTDGVPELRAESWGYSLSLSVRTGAGLDLLRTHLKQVAGYQAGEGLFTARQRHLDALRRAEAALKRAQSLVDSKMPELLAEELRQTQHDLSEITGAFTSDDLLGRIFSSFCIGK